MDNINPLNYDEMLNLRKECSAEYERYQEQQRKEYQVDYEDYRRLNEYEKYLNWKHKNQENAPISEMITDYANLKFQWYRKRFGSEFKRTVYG